MRPILEVDGIGRSFRGRVVLRSAGLRVYPGRISVLLGRNGVGKTTLFRVVVGRVRAEYGRLIYDGVRRARPSLASLAREGLMYTAQESALTPHFTFREHVDVFARRFDSWDRVGPVLRDAGLDDLLDRGPRTLSGGERQRASLALARIRQPRCLLADEPFAGVAPADRPAVAGALRALAEAGCGVVASGHDVEDLLAVADEVVWMVAGTTHDLGPPADAVRHDGFRRDYLGPRRGT